MTERPQPWTLDGRDLKIYPKSDVMDSITKEPTYLQSGKNACTLARSSQMRTLLVAVEPGKRLEEHEAPGPVTINVLSGRVRLFSDHSEKAGDLGPGDIAVMTADARHAVEALERSSFLVVIGGGNAEQGEAKP